MRLSPRPEGRRQDAGDPEADVLPGALERLATPCLVVDLDAMDRNIAAMAALTRRHGIELRPHAKVHRSSVLARRQLAAGAIGQSCATLGEATALLEAGIPGVLITSPVVAPAMIQRLIALQEKGNPLLVVDDQDNVMRLAGAASAAGTRIPVLIDIDVGQQRTGVRSVEETVSLAGVVAASSALDYRGVQAYWGQLQGTTDHAARESAVRERSQFLKAVLDGLAAAELRPQIVTGGGTGTAAIDAELGLFTELQPGSYLFMDAFYGNGRLWTEGAAPYEQALFVRCHVVSANQPDIAIVNAGTKAFGSDAEAPRPGRGAPADALYRFMGDEHGAVSQPADGAGRLKPGDAVSFIPAYCAQAVALYSCLYGLRGGLVDEILPIDAKGR